MKYLILAVAVILLLIAPASHAADKDKNVILDKVNLEEIIEEKMVYVSVPSLNIRAGAGTQYETRDTVPADYPLRVLTEKDGWYKVALENNNTGWAYKSMVTDAVPSSIKVNELEKELDARSIELEQTKKQLQIQLSLDAKLAAQSEKARMELKEIKNQNESLKRTGHIKSTVVGIAILLLGWLGGFFTGFFKRQAEDKRFLKMMIEANTIKNSLKTK